MSYSDGYSALKLEMPSRVPRTEYSADTFYKLITAVTGIPVDENSASELIGRARRQFVKDWNYDMFWNILVHSQIYDGHYTKMGHASYAGQDFSEEVNSPFATSEDVLKFNPEQFFKKASVKEWTNKFNDNYLGMKNQFSDCINMTGIYTTCMSGLIELFGWQNLLEAAGDDISGFGELTNRYVNFIQPYFEALALCESPVVMVHDDIVWTEGAFLHPEFYRKFIFPNYKKLFAPLRENKKTIIYTSDGNYTEFIDDIASCNVNCFVLEPMTDMNYVAEKFGKTHSFVGNADTRVLLSGSKDEIYAEVKRCMDIGKKCPGFIMAVGNHIPANTPIENALFYNDCYNKLSKR